MCVRDSTPSVKGLAKPPRLHMRAEVNNGSIVLTRTKVTLASLMLAVLGCVLPSPQLTGQSRTVPLVSDTCPEVHFGDSVSLDFNPLFDPEWPVTSLSSLGLTFVKLAGDDVHLTRSELPIGGHLSRVRTSTLGNGFFHVELRVPARRFISFGTYRLVGASAVAQVTPEFRGTPPQMTRSPVEERYCITIVPSQDSQAPQGGS